MKKSESALTGVADRFLSETKCFEGQIVRPLLYWLDRNGFGTFHDPTFKILCARVSLRRKRAHN